MMIFAVLTTAAGLLVFSFVTGFFLSAFGPVLIESFHLITEARLYTLGFGFVMVASGIGWLLGAPAAGQCFRLAAALFCCRTLALTTMHGQLDCSRDL